MGLVLVALIVTIVATLWWLLKRPKHPIDALPGPKPIPVFGNSLDFVMHARDVAYARFNEYSRQYAPFYRTWHGNSPVIHPVGPNYVEPILASSQHITKSFEYQFFTDWIGTGLLISGGSKWHSRRKLLTPAFHFSILEQFVPVFSDKTRILIEKLHQHVDKPDGVDIVPQVALCALDIICETAMGTAIDAQRKSDSPYVSAIYRINDLIAHRVLRPWLWKKWIFYLTPSGRQYAECLHTLHSFTRKVIKERKEEFRKSKEMQKHSMGNGHHKDTLEGKKRKIAFLDLLLEASEEGNKLTDEDIREEVDTFMFEGHDTTAMAMSWALFFLGSHPDIQAQCMEELDEIFSDSKRDPTLTDLGNMKYLERVIKETLRLRPSVHLISRELKHDLELDGHTFPPETEICVQIMNIHRNPEYFPDPEKFDPDRFLPENCVGRHPYAYIPFSAGPRNCIGQKFAMLEMKNLLSTFLRNFKIESLDTEKHSKTFPDMILRPKYGIQLKLYSR